MKKFNIAIVQHKRDSSNQKDNTKKGLELISKAKLHGADFVLFPECWITGYDFPEVDLNLSLEEITKDPTYTKWSEQALDENSDSIKEFCNIAKLLEIGVVITGFTKGENRPRNTAFVIDRKGDIILKYDKVHTCDFSYERLLEGGTEFKVCEFDGIKIGIMICYDREYPESARMLMLKGAELILVPNDCGSMQPRVQALSTRAYENMTGVIMANPPGEGKGCSCAFSPIIWDKEGRVVNNNLLTADEETEGIFIVSYDIEQLRAYRSSEMMGNTFRKVKAYDGLLSETIKDPFLR